MAFDPSKYKNRAVQSKPLPVLLLLDVSGSMTGEKIEKLYDATVEMVDAFVKEAIKETVINIGIITFGSSVDLHTNFTPVSDLQNNGINKLIASGMTPLGTTLEMAKDIMEDRDMIPSNAYRPAVVLVSDGAPNDEWRGPLDRFINSGRSEKCQRFAVAIGNDADRNMLEEFTKDSQLVFFAEDASSISENFKKVTMSLSTRSKATDPNKLPETDKKFDEKPKYNDEDDEDDEF